MSMREYVYDSPEVTEPAERITNALQEWLDLEILTASYGRNSVLSDYAQFRTDPGESVMGKANGHHARLPMWTEQFEAEPNNEYIIARQLFATQMFLSGAFRNYCLFNATDQASYDSLRSQGHKMPLSIDAAMKLRDTPSAPLDLDALVARTLEVNEKTYQRTVAIASEASRGTAARATNNQLLVDSYIDWFTLAADYIDYASQAQADGLDGVPFLQPKSISDSPQVEHPFAITY